MKYLLLLISALFLLPLRGEVFTLWPFSGGGASASGSLAREIPGIKDPLFSEAMTVNGINLNMTVSPVDIAFTELLEYLLNRFKPENLRTGSDEIRVAYKIGDNTVERWLFVNSGPGKPVTLFRVSSPESIPQPKDWPAALPPLPDGAIPTQVIYFPGRKASYGSFQNAGASKEQSMRQLNDQLKAQGWQPVGKEGEPQINGTGDIFIRRKPRQILWADFGELGTGAFYTKPF